MEEKYKMKLLEKGSEDEQVQSRVLWQDFMNVVMILQVLCKQDFLIKYP
jgi:hypothetical protein